MSRRGTSIRELSAEIMQLFVDFSRVGVTVLIASHDLALISRLRHRILTLREGRLVGLVAPGVVGNGHPL
jgi:cell division transport system ATP-binding protein